MKKETIAAVIFGIVFGTMVALVFIFQGRQSQLEKNKTISSSLKLTPIISTLRVNSQPFIIEKPQDKMITDTSSVTIEGRAPKDSLIIIQSPIKEIVLKNEKEQFKVLFPLAYGENVINATLYPNDTQLRVQEKQLRVYYLDNQL